MRSPRLLLLPWLFAFVGCPKEIPTSEVTAEPDAGVSEADLIAPKVDALEAEVALVVRATDQALWKHWMSGTPLDVAAATRGHDALFSKRSLATLRRARELRPLDAPRIQNLERWLCGELVARAVAAESEALANLEASVTFTVDGREFAWRDLNKFLLNEKSAVKRRALWARSHTVALRLEAAILRRDEKMKEVLAELDLPPPLEFAALMRQMDLEALRRTANEVLFRTDEQWKETLRALSEAELKLPLAALSRADLPRLLRPPAPVDAQFPKPTISARARATLASLGAERALTLELEEAPLKSPLPLTVALAGGDVRVSFKPVGGLRDQQALLAEVGAALVLRRAEGASSFAQGRLAMTLQASETSELFASLVSEEQWLANGRLILLPEVVAAAKAQRLFLLRRAAGVVLSKLETHGLSDDAEARAKFVNITARALGLTPNLEDGTRWRLETEDFLRSAAQLLAMLAADERRASLGDGWWLKPDALK